MFSSSNDGLIIAWSSGGGVFDRIKVGLITEDMTFDIKLVVASLVFVSPCGSVQSSLDRKIIQTIKLWQVVAEWFRALDTRSGVSDYQTVRLIHNCIV